MPLSEDVRQMWLRAAADGHPPPPEQVARIAYKLDVPWHWKKHFLPILDSIRPGGPKHKFLRIVSRGSGKTTLSRFLILYACEYIIPFLDVREENKRLYLIGREQKHVNSSLMQSLHADIARYAPWLKHEEWQDMGPDTALNRGMKGGRAWGREQFDLTNGVSIRGRSINQGLRGEHCYVIVLDDLLDENSIIHSQHYRDLVQGALLPALEPGGVILIEGTPLSPSDFHALIQEDESWDTVELPAIDEEGELGYEEENRKEYGDRLTDPRDLKCLWPGRMNFDALMQERGSTRYTITKFQREYMLQRNADDGALVHPDDLAAAKDATLSYEHVGSPGQAYYGGIDPSSLKHDDAAICLGAVDNERQIVLRFMRRIPARGKDTQGGEMEVIDALNEVYTQFNAPTITVESNGFQGVIRPLMERLAPGSESCLHNHALGTNKHTESGWLGIRTLFRQRRIRLPYGPTEREVGLIEAGTLDPSDIEAKRLTDQLIEQLRHVYYENGKVITDQAAHDDLVSAFYLMTKAAEMAPGGDLVVARSFSGGLGKEKRPEKTRSAEFGDQAARGQWGRVIAAKKMHRRLRGRRF